MNNIAKTISDFYLTLVIVNIFCGIGFILIGLSHVLSFDDVISFEVSVFGLVILSFGIILLICGLMSGIKYPKWKRENIT